MATVRVRYFVRKPGRPGELERFYWQPSAELAEQGYEACRVPENWRDITDAAELEAAAITTAQALNAALDAKRAAAALEGGAAPVTRASKAAARALTVPRTMRELIKHYRTTTEPGALLVKRNGQPRPWSTQRGYIQCLERIEAWAGDAPVIVISKKRIKKLKQGLRRTPSFCNAVIRVLRLLLQFAVDEEWITVNPASKPGLVGTDPSGLIYPPQAVTMFVDMADALETWSVGTAVLVDEWLGQREGDMLRLPRRLVQRNHDGTVTIRQRKGDVAVSLPIGMVPHLVKRCDEELERLDKRYKDATVQPATLIVSEKTGRPYSEDFFRKEFARVRRALADKMRRDAGFVVKGEAWWSDEVAKRLDNLPAVERTAAMALEARRAASFEVDFLLPGRDSDDPDAFWLYVEDLQFMHLRHTAVTRLAEAGCTDELISVISGHSLESIKIILKRYLIRTKKLARLAFQKRMDAEGIVALPAPNSSTEGGAV